MAYDRGNAKQIIVGAAALFVSKTGEFDPDTTAFPAFVQNTGYDDTLANTGSSLVRNVGYTMNGLELQFQPDFGEVQVDQLLDVAKLYKQGMQVNLNTAFAEATLENLLVSIAAPASDYETGVDMDDPGTNEKTAGAGSSNVLNLSSGNLGECPVERGMIAVGPGTGDCDPGQYIERVYVAYRALSIDSVTVSAKRDEASMFEVSFRLLPASNGSYGKIVDRTIGNAS